MANITIWPSQPLDGDQWERNTWDIGTPITKEKLENLEEGIAVLATQMKAILGEFEVQEIDPSSLQLNSSRLDTIQKWITAAENGTYDFTKGSIAARIDSLATEVWGSNTTSGTSRIDKNDNKIAAIAAELGGIAPDGSSTTYGGTTRLDTVITKASSIATEIWGSDTTSGDSRIDKLTVELYGSNVTDYNTTSRLDSAITKLSTIATELYGSDNTSVTSRLDDLEKEICGGTITRDTTNGGYSNSRIDSIESVNTNQNNRLTALENELSGSGTGTSGSSRLDNLQTWIAGTSNAQYEGTAIALRLDSIETLDSQQNSRLDGLEASRTTDESRLDSLEASRTADEANIATLQTDNTTNKTNISNIINEIGGTYTSSGFTNSQISKIPSIIEKNDTQDSNIGKIKTEIWGPDKDFNNESRIDVLESGLSATNSTVAAHESRISRIETGAIVTKIFIYNTTNTEASDTLTLPENTVIDNNAISFIILQQNTIGVEDLKIITSEKQFNVKINDKINLKAAFFAGALLGLYRNNDSLYIFNAPVLVASSFDYVPDDATPAAGNNF